MKLVSYIDTARLKKHIEVNDFLDLVSDNQRSIIVRKFGNKELTIQRITQLAEKLIDFSSCLQKEKEDLTGITKEGFTRHIIQHILKHTISIDLEG